MLMETIQDYKKKNLLWVTDWKNLPLLVVDGPGIGSSSSSSLASRLGSTSLLSNYSANATTPGSSKKRSRWGGGGRGDSSSGEESEEEEGEVAEEEGETSYYGPSRTVSSSRGGRGRNRGGRGAAAASNNHKKLKRGARGAAAGAGGGGRPASAGEDEEAKRKRAARFYDGSWKPRAVVKGAGSGMLLDEYGGVLGFDFGRVKPIVGTCQVLEKEYFRLNEIPDPNSVRPLPVLKKALDRLKSRFAALPAEQEKREADYKEYLWTQLKAIRQDLLIQNIKDLFTVEVYETHARVALQCADLNEYNQCQTQLMELYREGLVSAACFEFYAYRLLYYVYLQSNPKYQDGDAGLIRILSQLTPEV